MMSAPFCRDATISPMNTPDQLSVGGDAVHFSAPGLFKSVAVQEGAQRILYMQASDESVDLHGEKMLAKSLQGSADYFLKYGNIDLNHRSILPPRHPNEVTELWEIGKPLEVSVVNDRTLVKAAIYSGDGPGANNANIFWDFLTNVNPAVPWYPSVGGSVLPGGKTVEIDPVTKDKVTLISSVRWSNIGLSRTPVNTSVPAVSVFGSETFAKCLTADGHFDLSKALEAGTGTDSATLTGGAALGTQSLDSHIQATLPAYEDVQEALAKHIRSRSGGTVSLLSLTRLVEALFDVPEADAAQLARHFLVRLDSSRRNQ